ncbi:pilin [Thiopseudomonas denitrificans]|uniref:Pilin n=1 Tax=Thiopseudomonas denitrificans TaxID=1501432 RepID=A0A4R6U6S8_9GAMM|nr:pilin [Thiopseudomonas denitrificans]TDQ40245.1 type IV pilus assembly protein PilA [Thiopseudomonas denitrificans]
MKNMQKGFTLIELMIVVAIIGILAAIALPAYQDYTTRAKVSEILLSMSQCRTSVTEVYQSGASLPTQNHDNWGCTVGASAATQYVQNLNVLATGIITATSATAGVGNGADNMVISMAPLNDAGNVATRGQNINRWRCGLAADGTTMPVKFLPASCRGN